MTDEALLPTFEPRNENENDKKQAYLVIRMIQFCLIGLLGVGCLFLVLKSPNFISTNSLSSDFDFSMVNLGGGTTGEVVYLNASNCVSNANVSCYANNVDGFYLALNFSRPHTETVPTLTLTPHDVIELIWILPETPVRYLGVTVYVKVTSLGIPVFGDVGETLNHVQIAQYCNLSTINELWGSTIRLLFSVTDKVEKIRFGDNLCTLIMPIPGDVPLTNFTDRKDRKNNEDINATHFTILARLTAPQSISSMFRYLNNLTRVTKLREFQVMTTTDKPYPYPTYLPRSYVSGEINNFLTKQLYRALVNHVVDELFMMYPSINIHQVDASVPWLNNINYTYLGGYACINTSNDCQGAQVDATYMRSRLHNFSKTSHLLTIGAIHHDFLDTSFYSSMTLYKLTSSQLNSGAGVLGFLDIEQRGSAVGYITNPKRHPPTSPSLADKFWDSNPEFAEAWRITDSDEKQTAREIIAEFDEHQRAKFAQNFFVIETSYKCLDKLPQSTRCKTFSTDVVPENSNVFMLGRTYANPGPDPVDLLPDIVLHVILDD